MFRLGVMFHLIHNQKGNPEANFLDSIIVFRVVRLGNIR